MRFKRISCRNDDPYNNDWHYNHFNILFNDTITLPPMKGTGLLYYKGEIEEVILPKWNEPAIFLGAIKGHLPLYINCFHCDYVGVCNIEGTKGATHYLLGLATFGVSMCTTLGTDTHHYCPSCLRKVGYAKLF